MCHKLVVQSQSLMCHKRVVPSHGLICDKARYVICHMVRFRVRIQLETCWTLCVLGMWHNGPCDITGSNLWHMEHGDYRHCDITGMLHIGPCPFKDPGFHVRGQWIIETLKHPAGTIGRVARFCCSSFSRWKATQISRGSNPKGTIQLYNRLNREINDLVLNAHPTAKVTFRRNTID